MTDRRFGVGFHYPLRTRPGGSWSCSPPGTRTSGFTAGTRTSGTCWRRHRREPRAQAQRAGHVPSLAGDLPNRYGWLADGSPKDRTPYRLPEAQEFEFRLTQEGEEGLRAALSVWTCDIQGTDQDGDPDQGGAAAPGMPFGQPGRRVTHGWLLCGRRRRSGVSDTVRPPDASSRFGPDSRTTPCEQWSAALSQLASSPPCSPNPSRDAGSVGPAATHRQKEVQR
jgi:hypothetical protein